LPLPGFEFGWIALSELPQGLQATQVVLGDGDKLSTGNEKLLGEALAGAACGRGAVAEEDQMAMV
jgi:hypothetical protein